MDKNIEIAKSFFVLAQIFGVVAGLFILAAGFFSVSATQMIDTQKTMFDLCKESTIDILDINVSNFYNWSFSDCVGKIQEPLTDYYKSSNSFSMFLMLFGIILGFGSLVVWCIGKGKIERENLPHNLLLIVTLFLISIAVIIANNITKIH